jgi:hypothetical protein
LLYFTGLILRVRELRVDPELQTSDAHHHRIINHLPPWLHKQVNLHQLQLVGDRVKDHEEDSTPTQKAS